MHPISQIASPSWTDVVQAVGVLLGVLLTIITVFKLFIKDSQREHEINTLSNIASKQDEQLIEFKMQTGEMQNQSLRMQESNELFQRQIEVLTQFAVTQQGYQENNLKIEFARRKSENRPFFSFIQGRGAGYTDGDFASTLLNSGNTAFFTRTISSSSNPKITFFSPPNPDQKIEKGERITIALKQVIDKTNNANRVEFSNFKFDIEYADKDGIHYRQTIKNEGNGYVKVENPIEIDDIV